MKSFLIAFIKHFRMYYIFYPKCNEFDLSGRTIFTFKSTRPKMLCCSFLGTPCIAPYCVMITTQPLHFPKAPFPSRPPGTLEFLRDFL